MESEAKWAVVQVLPNLVLPGWLDDDPRSGNLVERGITLDTDSVAIVRPEDERVVEFLARVPEARKLVQGFCDEMGKRIRPSVLILRKAGKVSIEEINAFRTAVALSCVLRARAALVGGAAHAQPAWSDHFDVHPAELNLLGRLIVASPALNSLYGADTPFVGQPSPHVSHDVLTLYPDQFLYWALGKEWQRLHGGGSSAGETNPAAVFRALDVAYLAASSPTKLGGVANEWGISVALWVSAVEILAAAASSTGRGSAKATHALLGSFQWRTYEGSPWAVLDRQAYPITVKGKPVPATAIQDAAHKTYAARDKYLHGDATTEELLLPWGKDGPSLPMFAPIVFRMALAAYLRRQYPRPESLSEIAEIGDFGNEHTYATAIMKTYRLPGDAHDELDSADYDDES